MRVKARRSRGVLLRRGTGGMDIGIGFVVVGMADVEGAVAHVFTGIRRGVFEMLCFWS